MRRQHRLGPLHVGVAGQDQVLMPLGRLDEGDLQGLDPAVDPVERIARPELDVGGDLVVAAPRRVELAADVADPVDQRGLDVHVDIFPLQSERERPRDDLGPDFGQSPHNLLAFIGGEESDVGEHLGMRDRAPDVVLEEPTIKGDGFGELLDPAVGSLAKPAAPGLVRHRDSLQNDESILPNPLANRRSV